MIFAGACNGRTHPAQRGCVYCLVQRALSHGMRLMQCSCLCFQGMLGFIQLGVDFCYHHTYMLSFEFSHLSALVIVQLVVGQISFRDPMKCKSFCVCLEYFMWELNPTCFNSCPLKESPNKYCDGNDIT